VNIENNFKAKNLPATLQQQTLPALVQPCIPNWGIGTKFKLPVCCILGSKRLSHWFNRILNLFIHCQYYQYLADSSINFAFSLYQ